MSVLLLVRLRDPQEREGCSDVFVDGSARGSGLTATSSLPLRPADVLVVLGLFAVGLLLRLPLSPFGQTVEEALDPILSALAIRDDFRFVAPPFLHFGYGRGISWLPLVIGTPEGLLEVTLRRSVVQALVAPLVYLAGRSLIGQVSGSALAPALFALVLATSGDFLQTAVSGHETYMAAEWGAMALLAVASLASAPKRGAGLLGVCLAMAVMNHPLAAPTLLLLFLAPRGMPRYIAWSSAALLLFPQALRFGVALVGGFPDELLPPPGSGPHGTLGELLAVFRPASNIEVLILMLALPVSAWLLRGTPRRGIAWIGCAAMGLALLEVTISGSSNGWYWRPLAPLMALLGSLSLAVLLTRRSWVAPVAAVLACGVALVSVGRTAAAFEDCPSSLRYVGHVTALGSWLERSQEAGPWGLRAIADIQGTGRQQLAPLAVDRRLAETEPGLFLPLGEGGDTERVLLHVEAAPEALGRFVDLLQGEGELVAIADRFALVELPNAGAVTALERRLCALGGGALRFDDPRRWMAILDQPARVRREPSCAAP